MITKTSKNAARLKDTLVFALNFPVLLKDRA